MNSEVEAVKDYYEKNTRWFLISGRSLGTQAIHQALWPEGVGRHSQALDVANNLIAGQALELWKPGTSKPLRILDLGCGVGGSMFSLVKVLPIPLHMVGVTISPLQVRIAEQSANKRGLMQCCEFIEADFHNLPEMQPFELAFAIESFIQASDAGAFFSEAFKVMKPGGRLVIIDTFLTPEGSENRENPWVEAFRTGWLAESLMTSEEAVKKAEAAGLRLLETRDLSGGIKPGTFVSRQKQQFSALAKKLRLKGSRWDSLAGGVGFEQGLAAGLLSYQMLVFNKKEE